MVRNSRRRLHADYKAVYTNMCMYLQGKAINTWCMRRIREDILDIALDNQTRGVSAVAAFGDYQSFTEQSAPNNARAPIQIYRLRAGSVRILCSSGRMVISTI